MAQEQSAAASVPTGRMWHTHRPAGRQWGLLLVNGLVFVVVGVAVLVWPRASLVLVGVLFAITLLVNGVTQLGMAFADRHRGTSRRLLLAAFGVVSILFGVLCLLAPLRSLVALTVVVGVWWIGSGLLSLLGSGIGIAEGDRAWAVTRGIVGIIGGLVVLVATRATLVTLVVVIGVVLVVLGVAFAVDAFRTRARVRADGITPGR